MTQFCNRAQHAALFDDACRNAASDALSQRMRTAGFGEAAQQGIICGFQKNYPALNASRSHAAHHCRQRRYGIAAAGINTDGDFCRAGFERIHQCRNQRGGQVIDRKIACVFQHFKCDAFT